MLSDKIQEIKTSMRRIYMRFMTLTAVVVFGAIAIAQAQKNEAGSPTEGAADTMAHVLDGAKPIPIPAGDFGDESQGSDARSGYVAQASGELEIPDRPTTSADESSAWSGSQESEAELQEAPVDEPVATDPPPSRFRSAAPEEATADAPSDDAAEVPAEESEVSLPSRRNPFRGATAADSGQASSEELDAPPLLHEGQAGAVAAEEEEAEAADASAEEPAASEGLTEEPAPREEYSNELEAAQPLEEEAPAASLEETPAPTLPPRTSAPRAAVPTRSQFRSHESVDTSGEPATELAGETMNVTASGHPGPPALEGPQSPTLTVEKIAPPEIQVGRPAKFQIRVRNTGRSAAENVLIRDEVPAGTKFLDANPKASRAADGAIFWEVGTMSPGQEVTVNLQLMPVEEGPIGSVAKVSFQAAASARTRSTKPGLVLEHTGPMKVLVGDTVRFQIKITNPGSGAANQVVLEEDVPQGLTHSSGAKLEYAVGTIQPGQTRHLELTLKASEAGSVVNTLFARAEGGLEAKDVVELEVTAPKLDVAIEGPSKRYLERQATFSVSVANPGTADARDVELIAHLPTGLKFVSTNNSGYYDQARHAVIWSLEQLPAGEMGKAQFTAVPIEMGNFQIRAESHAEPGLEAQQEHALQVEGIAALLFGVADKVDPIEVNGQTAYEIRVVNQGSKAATNIQFTAIVPEGLRPVSAEGPTPETIDGQQVVFGPLDRLPPKEQAVFRVMVEGAAAGDHRFRVQMTSGEIETPVIKEESTRVYAD